MIRTTRDLLSNVVRRLGLRRPPISQLGLALPRTVREVSMPSVPQGFRLRIYAPQDAAALTRLFRRSGFDFNEDTLRRALSICLPRGCFVVEHETTGTIAAAMMARHLSSPSHLFGGRIDWLATDPDYRGHGLAGVCARAATRRLIEAGYDDIWVTTDDDRLGALKVFLGIGFKPVSDAASAERWKRIYRALGRDDSSL